MSDLQDGAVIFLALNGTEITTWQNCTATINSGNVRIDVVKGGLIGFTPGPGDTTIEIGGAVLSGGLEYDALSACAAGTSVEYQVGIGPDSLAGTGKVDTANVTQSTGDNTSFSMTIIAPKDGMK